MTASIPDSVAARPSKLHAVEYGKLSDERRTQDRADSVTQSHRLVCHASRSLANSAFCDGVHFRDFVSLMSVVASDIGIRCSHPLRLGA